MSRTLGAEDARQPLTRRQFASDNYAGVCPEAVTALQDANLVHAVAYGDDSFTHAAIARIREFFETDCDVFFTFNGTAANALSIATICRSYQAVACHEVAHLATDECGAPEFFTGGAKVLPVGGADGQIDVQALEERIAARPDVHFSQISAVSVTQATEVGTVYPIEQLQAISDVVTRYHLRFHMDGARFANALAHLGTTPAEATWKLGVDLLSLGGTKNGLMAGDAIVSFRPELSEELSYRRKQSGQLCSKMRFLSAPWEPVLSAGAYLRHAEQANAMARRLRTRLESIGGVQLLYRTEANSVFVDMDAPLRDGLRARGWKFYALIGDNVCRLMCSWDTTAEDVDAFCRDVEELCP
ncbi:MAG: low specificity L-threonine aldolase [Planctomycetales bacterium]|nr:low specificity L-threonine aldolase [Planctomycetales bacterium]